ncbi:hypothetical protein [Streptomyces sp. NPDC056883]|uniref:hypothetical protein n=1 Tax=Streptomyces sp. NPDC056883 TaxID=3345959 RepID=UPI0036CB84FC
MNTFHQQAAQGVLDKYLEDPEAAKALSEARTDIRAGRRFSRRGLEDVGQIHRIPHPGEWPFEQMACFLDIHVMAGAGSLVRFRIDVGATPLPDAARVENAALLAARAGADVDAFEIWVDQKQNKADADGTLTLVREVESTRSSGEGFLQGPALCRSGPCTTSVEMPVTLRPFTVPLEIGTTMPSRTLAHIVRDGGVAR